MYWTTESCKLLSSSLYRILIKENSLLEWRSLFMSHHCTIFMDFIHELLCIGVYLQAIITFCCCEVLHLNPTEMDCVVFFNSVVLTR